MIDNLNIHHVTRIEVEVGRDLGGAEARTIRIVCADGSERRVTVFSHSGPVPVRIHSTGRAYDPRADEANERGVIDAQTLAESEA